MLTIKPVTLILLQLDSPIVEGSIQALVAVPLLLLIPTLLMANLKFTKSLSRISLHQL
jgi:hypothetical protein